MEQERRGTLTALTIRAPPAALKGHEDHPRSHCKRPVRSGHGKHNSE